MNFNSQPSYLTSCTTPYWMLWSEYSANRSHVSNYFFQRTIKTEQISDCRSRVSVAQRSEHRYVDSETLGSIPGWGSQSFRIYNYDCIKILSSYINHFLQNMNFIYNKSNK